MQFTPDFLDALRERIVLSDLIGRRVKLTRKGRESLGLCPFHHEKTPSFTINDEKGFYHCFGCGAHGDAIRFLVELEKMPFVEAVEMLANMVGMPLPKVNLQERMHQEKLSSLIRIMEIACQYFEEELSLNSGKVGKEYLLNRGLSEETIKKYRLGYVPRGNGLLKKLQQNKVDLRQAQKLGLLAFNQTRSLWHDYFYERVMFPIFDRKKRVIGFSGRMLEKGEPKYLNSPETELFHKGEQLFELPFAIDTIRKKNEAIVVEGNMDVISLHQHGWTQAVAPLGTAFTENQLQILWHLCDEPIMCFDGDTAGQHAMIRAMNRALPLLIPGKSLRFATLPSGQDPDDMMRHNPSLFKSIIQEASSFIDVFWNHVLTTHLLKTPEQLAKAEKDAFELIQKIQNEIVRSLYAQEIKYRFKQLTYQLKNPKFKPRKKIKITLPETDKILLAYLYAYPKELAGFVDELNQFNFLYDIHEQALYNAWVDAVCEGKVPPVPETDNALLQKIEKIQKCQTPESVIQEITHLINHAKLTELKELFSQKQAEYLKTEDLAVKAEIENLRQEIENFMDNEEE